MVTFILPGYSPKNRIWLEKVTESVEKEGLIRPIYWDHWDDPEKVFNAQKKAEILVRLSKGEEMNIVAKSIGTLVAAYMMKISPGKIKKVVFCGIPVTDMSEAHKADMISILASFPAEKMICIQNDKDPHGSLAEVKSFLSKTGKEIKVISKPANNHEYLYFREIGNFLK